MNDSILVRGIGCLLPVTEDSAEGIPGAAVLIRDGRVAYAGPEDRLPAVDGEGLETLDARNGLVTPGLVDCHTHLVFAGSRADEFEMRARGASYTEIASRGGGILRTVSATRAATHEELLDLATRRAHRALSLGVTTMEVKSGYGLDLATEMRLLRVVADLASRVPIDFVPTFLGAHAIPPEARAARDRHVDAIVREWIPAVAEAGLARFCDVFCEGLAFTRAESERILLAGLDAGLLPKVHADQLTRCGGALLAAAVGAVSADHLECADEGDLEALSRAGTVAVLLPGCGVSLCRPAFPDARRMRQAGLRVAVATDFNPGSSVTQNLLLMGTFAMAFCGLTTGEAWASITRNAADALALPDRGRLDPGSVGDLVVFACADERDPFYQYATPQVDVVVKAGRVVFRRES
jgi:imidazolonepropionase